MCQLHDTIVTNIISKFSSKTFLGSDNWLWLKPWRQKNWTDSFKLPLCTTNLSHATPLLSPVSFWNNTWVWRDKWFLLCLPDEHLERSDFTRAACHFCPTILVRYRTFNLMFFDAHCRCVQLYWAPRMSPNWPLPISPWSIWWSMHLPRYFLSAPTDKWRAARLWLWSCHLQKPMPTEKRCLRKTSQPDSDCICALWWVFKFWSLFSAKF